MESISYLCGVEKRVLAFFLFILGFSMRLPAQCAMCRATAESALRSGNAMVGGLNSGIVYLMAFPYIAIGTVAFLWYRHNKNQKT
ncbi:MAG: hypothetical protein V6Z82_06240 [Flavobacteriales bacterium]